mmetsp:Transcript_32029/g.44402  ORF Transcript_32029/g.44402 Transcript_32029/m.44402 type:complete len:220 (+) Transcript_32029:127-786(+)|eukprot:CAMPEP_0196592488 /NCGR_PEP_ID=MMETSP1081-20130531/72876_1 /TAXON_ID=36882 /ORGANISM="Pyramimonas amylifera, Strain CCMP720" /LENGTH=219 /DNA_ID=CAMNT_0041916203 /DNA_START=127 /DNA_END=786 /DNA_ORIENTATION=+
MFGLDESDQDLETRWTRILDESKALTNEMHTMIKERSILLAKGDEAAKLSAQIRRGVGRVRAQVGQLGRLLRQMEDLLSPAEVAQGREEVARVAREVEVLEAAMQRNYRAPVKGVCQESDRGGVRAGGTVGAELSTTLTSEQLQLLQQRALDKQDSQLDQLSKHMQNLKGISTAINEEISVHNELLDGLEDHMASTTSKLKSQQEKIQTIEENTICLIC